MAALYWKFQLLCVLLFDGKLFRWKNRCKVYYRNQSNQYRRYKANYPAIFLQKSFQNCSFDGISFLGVNGWHDSWSDTRVINIKNYQAEIQAKREIEDLGRKEFA